jgi:hypothetical protein
VTNTTIEWTWTGAVPGFGAEGESASVEVDAIVREHPRAKATATEHPVESGVAVTDHVRAGPRTLSLEGVISDAPTRVPGTHMDGVTGEQRDGVLTFSAPFDRTRPIRDVFVALVESGTLVTIRTGFDVYEGFVLVSFETQREGPAGALAFTLDAQQIRIVESEVVEAPAELRARRHRDRGEQSPVPVPEDTSEGRSVLAHGLDDARDRYQGRRRGGVEGSGW